MSHISNVHLAPEGDDEDLYSGFNDYNPSLNAEDVLNQADLQQAIAKTSYGRRPPAGGAKVAAYGTRLGTAVAGRLGTASGARIGTMATRGGGTRAGLGTAARPMTSSTSSSGGARPMTAVRGAGYSSQQNRTSTFDPLKSGQSIVEKKPEENPEEKCKALEKKVYEFLEDSIIAYDKGDYKLALEKAKEAGRKERAAVKLREQLGLIDQVNLDLTFNVLFNLAHQYVANDMYTEALNTYQVIVKNKMFTNAGKLKVNIGNIYFKKKEYDKAVKYYRMALDQVPNIQKETRIKIMNNIGVSFVKMNKYDEAISTFESCMEEKPDFRAGLNLILCASTLEDREKLREGFQRLLEISLDVDDEDKYMALSKDPHENLLLEVIKNDSLRQWEKSRRQDAERTILTAAKLISPSIASTFSEGYAWCVDCIKQSIYSELAADLEINKAIQYLKQRDLSAATEVLKAFEKKDTKVASAATNNLTFLYFLQENYKEAEKYAEKALTADRYNPHALVNRGNIHYALGEFEKARSYYREALSNEASCVEALFNLGIASKKIGKLEEALDCFNKLHNILRNNAQVLYQIGSIHEMLEDTSEAIEYYTQASSYAPTDPGLLAKLGELYDKEGDKSQAFQCHHDSNRYYPSNIDVIEWLGAYYIDAQFSEKAVDYFERATLIQPNEVKWQLMIASCHRRSGNYQKAFDKYKLIHRKFPENIECLKFLVRISSDMGLPDAQDYVNKLKKAEKVRELRDQRSTPPGRRSAVRGSAGSGRGMDGRPPSSRGSLRSAATDHYDHGHKQDIDVSYTDPLGPAPERLKTGFRRQKDDEREFENEEIGDDLLPE